MKGSDLRIGMQVAVTPGSGWSSTLGDPRLWRAVVLDTRRVWRYDWEQACYLPAGDEAGYDKAGYALSAFSPTDISGPVWKPIVRPAREIIALWEDHERILNLRLAQAKEHDARQAELDAHFAAVRQRIADVLDDPSLVTKVWQSGMAHVELSTSTLERLLDLAERS